MNFDASAYSPEQIAPAALQFLTKQNQLQVGDWVVLTQGTYNERSGTNTLQVLQVI